MFSKITFGFRILAIGLAVGFLFSTNPANALVPVTQKHEVKAGETLYSIAKQYQVSVDEIIDQNDQLAGKFDIKPGDILSITAVFVEAVAVPEEDHTGYMTHEVQTGETMYSISKQYKQTSLEKIMALNDMVTTDLKVGQILRIKEVNEDALFTSSTETKEKEKKKKWKLFGKKNKNEEPPANGETTTETVEVVDQEPVDESNIPKRVVGNDYEALFNTLAENGSKAVEKGVANYIKDFDYPDTYYALYSDAPIGSVLKLRNLMNNRIVFLKVIGNVSGEDKGDNIMVKITPAAAKAINALDDKFLVEVEHFQ